MLVEETHFKQWFQDLKDAAKEQGFSEQAIESMKPGDWRHYYDGGRTPKEAVQEDLSNT